MQILINVHSNDTDDNQEVEAIQMSINWWAEKENTGYHTEI